MDSNFDPNWDVDSSGSGASLLDYLNLGSKTATGVLGALNKPKTAAPAPQGNWAIIGGIAAAVLAVFVLLLVVAKK